MSGEVGGVMNGSILSGRLRLMTELIVNLDTV